MKTTRFDTFRFFMDIEKIRQECGATGRDLAEQAGITASTYSRIRRGHNPDLDGFSALCQWANLDPGSYFLPETTNET